MELAGGVIDEFKFSFNNGYFGFVKFLYENQAEVEKWYSAHFSLKENSLELLVENPARKLIKEGYDSDKVEFYPLREKTNGSVDTIAYATSLTEKEINEFNKQIEGVYRVNGSENSYVRIMDNTYIHYSEDGSVQQTGELELINSMPAYKLSFPEQGSYEFGKYVIPKIYIEFDGKDFKILEEDTLFLKYR